jgi:hypothetical protein
MGAPLLHDNASVVCMHGGLARNVTNMPRVRVGGQPIVTQQMSYVVSGCGLSASGSTPCATAQWVVAATRVRAGGAPVVLRTSQAVCAPTGTGLQVIACQTRVRGV